MSKRHKSILIIPPRSGRIRFLRIRLFVVLLLTAFFLAGFAGLFIPFSDFTLDVVEQNQKKNLGEQNQKLLKRIHGMRALLHDLDNKLDRMKAQKTAVEKRAGIWAPVDSSREHVEFGIKQVDRLLEYVDNTYAVYSVLADNAQSERLKLAKVPVLYPIVGESKITAGFALMRDPFTGTKKWHYGVDFAAQRGTQIIAAADGIVIAKETHRRWGQRIRIRHAYGFSTVYAHLGTINVRNGTRVKRGDVIATVGISGLTTGPHLHYEVWHNGKAVDPLDYIFPGFIVAGSSENKTGS